MTATKPTRTGMLYGGYTMLNRIAYNELAKRITVEQFENYDWYVCLDGQHVGFPTDRQQARELAFWLPSALDDILKILGLE